METLFNNIIQATGWSILHSLWQSALIYALLLPFQLKITGLNAKIRYIVAYSAICLMFLSFILTFISVFHWSGAEISTGLPHSHVSGGLSVPKGITSYIETIFPWLVALYLTGLSVQSVLVLKGYRKVQQLKSAAFKEVSGELNSLFKELLFSLKITRYVDFRLSDHIDVPLVVGYFKPVVLFPIALATQMDIRQIEAILIHELSHIRRNDYLFNLIRTVIEAILFFNPFIWMAGRLINIEREHACDDIVVSATHTPVTYAHALLKLELITAKSNPKLALAATGNNQHLYQRIKRITDMKTTYVNSKQKLLTVTLTLATIISLAWISPAKEQKDVAKAQMPTNTGKPDTEICLQDTSRNKVKTKPVKKPMAVKEAKPAVPPLSDKKPGVPPLPPADYKTAPLAPAAPRRVQTTVPKVPEPPAAPEAPEPLVIEVPVPDVSALSDIALNMGVDSPEFKASMDKFRANVEAKFANGKERAKIEKQAREIAAKFNSPQHKEMMRKLQIKAQQQAKIAIKHMKEADFEAQIQQYASKTGPTHIIIESDDTRKLKQSPEYQELKKKFDKDVAELRDKNARSSN